MANRKAGSGDGGNTGAKRSAAGKKGSGAAAGDAAAAQGGEGTAAKKTASTRSTAAGGDTAAESQPTKATKRAPAKGAAKSAGESTGGAAGKGGAKGAAKSAGRGGGKPDLRKDLRQFVSDNPQGWGHDQWQGLLSQLGERGHDTSNPDEIGMQLERERLSSRLEGIEGVSAQRARSIADRFGTLYSLRTADVDEIEREAGVSRDIAERIKNELR